jgi:hypothetical protein
VSATPEAVARAFYEAFIRQSHGEMEALYDSSVTFEDTLFRWHGRDDTMRMWRALLRNPASRFAYELRGVEGDVAKIHWTADYTLNGRPIHNEIDARLVVRNGLIVSHRDVFDWSRWARQAFPLGPLVGLPGIRQLLMGLVRRALRSRLR